MKSVTLIYLAFVLTIAQGLPSHKESDDGRISKLADAIAAVVKNVTKLFDPIPVNNIFTEITWPFSSVNIHKFDLVHAQVANLSSAVVRKDAVDENSLRFQLSCRIAELSLNGEYGIVGSIMNSTVEGSGDIKYVITDAMASLIVQFEEREREGKMIPTIVNIVPTITVGDVSLMMSNLEVDKTRTTSGGVEKYLTDQIKAYVESYFSPWIGVGWGQIVGLMSMFNIGNTRTIEELTDVILHILRPSSAGFQILEQYVDVIMRR